MADLELSFPAEVSLVRGPLVVTTCGQRTTQGITDTAITVITVLAWAADMDMAMVLSEASTGTATGAGMVDTDTLPSESPGVHTVPESPEPLLPLPVEVALEPLHLVLALPAA